MAFSRGSFNVLESEHAAQAGRKGGQSRSRAKRRAAAANGAKGGRRSTRTLGEFLLRRRLNRYQHNAITEAVLRLTHAERERFEEHFEPYWPLEYPDLETLTFVKRKPGRQMRHILRKFRLMARWLLLNSKPPAPRPPKDYVVIRVPKHEREREEWERRHPDMPFVATRPKRLYIETMASFRYLDLLLSTNPNRNFTVEDVKEAEGSRIAITDKVAEAVLDYLKFKHKPS